MSVHKHQHITRALHLHVCLSVTVGSRFTSTNPPPQVQRGAAEGQGDIYPVAPRSAASASCTRLRGRSKFPLSMNYGVQTPALGIQLWGPTAVQNQCAGSNGVGEKKQG